MYEFCRITFQKQLVAVLQHALLPVLEYAAEVYQPPPDIFNGKLPSIAGRKLVYTPEKYDIGSDPILYHILHACVDKKRNGSNHSGHLWKVTINFSVPTHQDHEFWGQPSLNGTSENVEENSIPLQVFAFGSSEQEAISLAIMKSINLIKLLREILRKWRETEDMKLFISKLIRKTTRPTFLDMNGDAALNMGAQLFTFYLRQQYGTQMRDQVWHSITTLITEVSKTCSAELQPLLKYYLVILAFHSSTHK